jgi:hypothetical protein
MLVVLIDRACRRATLAIIDENFNLTPGSYLPCLTAYFHNLREKQNLSHYKTYYTGCVLHQKKLLQDAGTYNNADWQVEGDSFINGESCNLDWLLK